MEDGYVRKPEGPPFIFAGWTEVGDEATIGEQSRHEPIWILRSMQQQPFDLLSSKDVFPGIQLKHSIQQNINHYFNFHFFSWQINNSKLTNNNINKKE